MIPFATPTDIGTFIRAGRAIFTLKSEKTGQHYTYRISHNKDKPAPLFVALLTGPDNGNDYTYLGILGAHEVLITKASKMKCDSPPVKALGYVLRHVARGQLPPDCSVYHEGRCGVCARALTVPESIERGIGPECWGKIGGG